MIKDEKILTILKDGKRLRPLLASISFKVCTGGDEQSDQYQKFLEGSVGVELAHSASLVHDDIIDGDPDSPPIISTQMKFSLNSLWFPY